jgi:hypothetical protein
MKKKPCEFHFKLSFTLLSCEVIPLNVQMYFFLSATSHCNVIYQYRTTVTDNLFRNIWPKRTSPVLTYH